MKATNQLPIFNGPKPTGQTWYSIRDAADKSKPVEILIYDQIGKDWWDDSGVGAKDFAESLKAIDEKREILVCINSPGGNVFDGLAIYNQLRTRKDKVTCRVDGVAASIASVIACAGKELHMAANSLLMIHDPYGMCVGGSEDMRKMADTLEKTTDVIAGVYEKKTGKSLKKLKDDMSEETWLTGTEAADYGFADHVLDEIKLAANFDLSCFRRVPATLGKKPDPQNQKPAAISGAATTDDIMNRKEIIALLKKRGIEVADNATDTELLALLTQATAPAPARAPVVHSPGLEPGPGPVQIVAPSAELLTLKAAIDVLQEERTVERKKRVTEQVQAAINEDRIPAAQRDNWVRRAVADETVLTDLATLPPRPPGAEPIIGIEIECESVVDIEKRLLKLQGREKYTFFAKHIKRLEPILNVWTISTELKRTVILSQVMRAFAQRIIPLQAFATIFNDVRLQGTNKINVPYIPLVTTASTDFVAANGYVFGDSDVDDREVEINKRKYQPVQYSSEEFRRQPYLSVMQVAEVHAEKLADDVLTDIFSIITAANFGAAEAPLAGINPTAFDVDEVLQLRKQGNESNWPMSGRSMVLDSDYGVNLNADSRVITDYSYGSPEGIREGKVQRIAGFDYFEVPNLPENGAAKIGGFGAYRSAVLVALSPIEPTPEVRSQLVRYDIVTDPVSGISIEYRLWGNPDMDQTREVIECNYGYAMGESEALKLITRP